MVDRNNEEMQELEQAIDEASDMQQQTEQQEPNFSSFILDDLGKDDEKTHIDHLIYGKSGAGKTRWTSSAPGPILLLTPDPTGHKAYPYKVTGKVINKVNEAFEALHWLEQGGSKKFQTVVFDGLSWFYDMMLKEMGEYFYRSKGAKDPDLMPLQGHQKVQKKFYDWLRNMINLTQVDDPDARVHVIMTTLDERLKEDEEAEYQVRPLVGSDKVNNKVPPFFSIVTYIKPYGEDQEGNVTQDRFMLNVEYKGILAKDRLEMFPLMGTAEELKNYYPKRSDK